MSHQHTAIALSLSGLCQHGTGIAWGCGDPIHNNVTPYPSPLLLLVTCCFHRFVFSRGGPDRTFDLTYNKLYGQFPRFLVSQAADLSDSCLCATNFTVSAGNQLYCPTKASLEGVNVTPNLLETFKQANYTCLLPKQKEPVSVAGAGMSRACIEDAGVLLSSRGRVCTKGQRVVVWGYRPR